jgi:type IV secretory pathway VirD2 relaxase
MHSLPYMIWSDMARIDEDRKVRLRPPKPRGQRDEVVAWSSGFKLLMHYARSTRKARNRGTYGGKKGNARSYRQRCAIRVTYLNNKTRGQWKAHGRYLARESAAHGTAVEGVGFGHDKQGIDIASRLENWQKADDERLWKLIISPEFGDQVDLRRLTGGLMKRMEKDLGTDLEWVAVEHHNTEHPHAHVVVRGVRSDGAALRMSRDYIQRGIRSMAENLCTRLLGYRTELDAAVAERREISESRFTSLDRRIMREASNPNADFGPQYFAVSRNPTEAGLSETARLRIQHESSRLAVLHRMGLAESTGGGCWLVRRDCEPVLRAMQRAADRQKTLAVHGVLLSDDRLQMTTLDIRDLTSIDGRILVHGEEEASGRSYLMLEGTDGQVYYIHHTPEMEELRSRRGLQTNSFIRLRKLSTVRGPLVEIRDMGDSEAILRNKAHLRETARQMMQRGVIPQDDGWKGWLGRYQKALREAAFTLERQRMKEHERRKGRDLGR